MDTRSIRLGTPQLELLEKISSAGTLPLDVLQTDDLMSLGGLGLIRLEADNVSATPRGKRFLAFSAEHVHA